MRLLGQTVTADFAVVTQVNASIRKSRMRPDQHPAANLVCGLDQFGSADFRIACRTQTSDDQLAVVVCQKKPVTLSNREHIGPTGRSPTLRRCECGPQLFAVNQACAGIFPVWPAGVNQAIMDEGCVMHP